MTDSTKNQNCSKPARQWLETSRLNQTPAFAPPASIALNFARTLSDVVRGTPKRQLTDQQLRLLEHKHYKPSNFDGVQALFRADTQIIVISHQPTTLPYAGVYGLFILGEAMKRAIETEEGLPAQVVFLALDADDATDRRIRSARVVSPNVKGGACSLAVPTGRSLRGVPQYLAAAPGRNSFEHWVDTLRGSLGGLMPRQQLSRKLEVVFNLVNVASSDMAAWALDSFLGFLAMLLGHTPPTFRISELLPDVNRTLEPATANWAALRETYIQSEKSARNGLCLELNKSPGIQDAFWTVCGGCFRRHQASWPYADMESNQTTCLHCSSPTRIEAVRLPRVYLEDLLPTEMLGARLVLTYAGGAAHVLHSQLAWHQMTGQSLPNLLWQPSLDIRTSVVRNSLRRLEQDPNDGRAQAALELSMRGRESFVGLVEECDLRNFAEEWINTMQEKGVHSSFSWTSEGV